MRVRFRRYLYFVISQGSLYATELSSGRSLERSLSSVIHPRTPIGNFVNLENIFSSVIKSLAGRSFFKPSPTIFLHLLDEVKGGYTQIEIRAFREAALGGGAREIFMPKSRTRLTKEQLLRKEYEEMDFF